MALNSSTNKFLTLVKSTFTNISDYVGNTADPCLTKGLVESSPTIYKSGASFYFDYSTTTNGSDLKFLKKFFGVLTAGNTFTISGGTYYVEETGAQYNFAGTYTFYGSTGFTNQYLNLGGVTYSPALIDGIYNNINFITPINYSAIKGTTAQYFISKFNVDNPNNIDSLGIYGNNYGFEEYLETSPGLTNNTRYLIDTTIKLNDGSQIIYLNSSNTIVNESRYFVPTTVSVYMRGVPDVNTLAAPTTLNGLIKKIDSDGIVVSIYQNQNLRQKYCRNLNDDTYFYDWFGILKTSTLENVLNPLAYNGLSLSYNYYSYVKWGVSFIVNGISPSTGENLYREVLSIFVDGTATNTANYAVSGANGIGTILKLDFSDASLFNTTIEPFLDANCSVRLNNHYYLNGIPGFDGSSFIYFKDTNSPSTIYLKFTQQSSLILQIQI